MHLMNSILCSPEKIYWNIPEWWSEALGYGWMVFPDWINYALWLAWVYFISLFFICTIQQGVWGFLDSAEDHSFSPCGILNRAFSSCAYSQLTGCTEVLLLFLLPEKLSCREEDKRRGSANWAVPYREIRDLASVAIAQSFMTLVFPTW